MIRTTMMTMAVTMTMAAGLAQAADYAIDTAHSRAHFTVRHMMVSNVRGEFTKVTGTIAYDEKNPAATKIDATIDVATIHTGVEQRDAHLKSPDFFDVAKFPVMTFRSKSARATAGGLEVKGDLTMHGVTKEVVLSVETPSAELKEAKGGARRGATATTKINRKDFGLTWNRAMEAGGVAVGEEVTIVIDVEAVRQAS